MKTLLTTLLYAFSTIVLTFSVAVGTVAGMVVYDVLSTKPAPVVEHVDRTI